MDKTEFRRLWNGYKEVTYDDILHCAKDWGLYSDPLLHPLIEVKAAVLKAAGCDEKEPRRGWCKWPQEKPTHTGEYLVRGIGGLNNKLHYWVCLWVGCDKSTDERIANRLFYGGNEFNECPSGEFEFIDVKEL